MDDKIRQLIEIALEEDIGEGDITSEALIRAELHAIGQISAKQPLVLAGIDIVRRVFEILEPGIIWDQKRKDGQHCENGDLLAIVQAGAQTLLKGERTALNILQRLSGVATLTRKYAEAVEGTKAKILDTRKTTPGMRALEKYAVRIGGGTNHRMGLYEHFLIKNNHISVAGSVTAALELAHKARKPGQLIEIEIRVLEEIEAAVRFGADIIMLDNMSVENVHRAVGIVKGQAKTEASGNITLDNVRSYAATGVDFVSIGAITHSAPAADIHMLTIIERRPGEHSISSLGSSKSKSK